MPNQTIAENATRIADAVNPPSFDAGAGVFTSLGYLLLVLGAILLLYWLIKRFGPAGIGQVGGGANNPRLVGRLFLGNRQSVAVVRFKKKTMVLGVTEQSINLLTETEEDMEPDADKDGTQQGGSGFAALLKRKQKNDEDA